MSEKKIFDELRAKQMDVQKQLVQANSQLSLKDRQKRKSELTMTELGELPADTKLYKSVGKSFILSKAASIQAELRAVVKTCEEDVAALMVRGCPRLQS